VPPTLYVLIGAPGAGKTTWAAEHAAALDARIIASDDVRTALAASGQGDPGNMDQVFGEVARRARAALAGGHNVILDATHWRRAARAYALELARAAGARPVAVWFDVPLATCLARNAARPAAGWGARTSAQAVREMHAALEPPGPGEFDAIIEVRTD
jgi:predicted kinase